MMSLNKSDVPEVAVPVVKNLDLLQVLTTLADLSLGDIAGAYYQDHTLSETDADQALQRIKGRMQVLRLVATNIK